MRFEFIEPFVAGTMSVLDSAIQCDIAKGGVSLVAADKIEGNFSVLIRLGENADGSVILNMDSDTALNICSAMNGEGYESLTPYGMDTIGELANMIAGNLASVMSDMGFPCNVSTPEVITADRIRDNTRSREVFQIPLFTEYGEVTLNVVMRTI